MTTINEASGILPYLQVVEELREQIAEGEYSPGDQLPSSRELANRYGIALTTAVKVIDALRDEGLVETKRGRGSFVRSRPELFRRGANRYLRSPEGVAPNLKEAKAGGWHDEVRAKRWRAGASKKIAARLGIAEGDPVTVAQYIWEVDGVPIQVGTQYEPLAVTGGTAIEEPVSGERGQPGVVARFDSIGITIDRVVEETRAKNPNSQQSELLKLGSNIPIIAITRTHWAGELAVETADIAIRGDRMVITTTHPVPPLDDNPEGAK
ncbi:GntR family transcriptional regulator [Nocardia sp. NPDC051832]|uniref:GntR family transcriptional regulator n=1 Tax=Nocardia sp. NPDC051832 TaxID=3155673 RepID=UPI00343CC671